MDVSKKIAKVLVKNNCIKTEELEICSYGLEIMTSTILQIVSIFIIALIMNNFIETTLFFLAFIPLRIYAGGYHADTKMKCYLTSLAVYGIFTLILKTMPQEYIVYVGGIAGILDVIIVFLFAPIVHINRTISIKEKNIYRKVSRAIVILELCLWLVMIFIFQNRHYATAFLMGQITVILSMVYTIAKDNSLKAGR